MAKFITAEEAALLVNDGATLAVGGFCGLAIPDEVVRAVEARFLKTGAPRDLTLFKSAGASDYKERGALRLCREGLINRVITSHAGLEPPLVKMVLENKILAYMLPMGTLMDILKATASHKPGLLTKVGLGTFADPLIEGSKANDFTKEHGEDIVSRVEISGEECLFYKTIPVDVCVIRATYADEDGNLSVEKEAVSTDQLEYAMATHASGGIVIAQVEEIVAKGSIHPRKVKIPAFMVDYVVKASPENHMQGVSIDGYRPELTGEIKIPVSSLSPLPLDNRKICGRRATMELSSGTLVNLGFGVPDAVAAVAAEEGINDQFTLSIEAGTLGGVPLGGLALGASVNPDVILDMGNMLSIYDGGGLDVTVLGLGEIDEKGNVNVSKFGDHAPGPGGFINISQNTKNVIFTGTFTTGKLTEKVAGGKLVIEQEGKVKKFKKSVEQISFSGEYAVKTGQNVTIITERAVFKLTPQGLMLVEVAPGVDIQKDILDQMEFSPLIDDSLTTMDERIFRDEPMNLKLK